MGAFLYKFLCLLCVFVNFCMHLSDICWVVALVWPAKGFRNQFLALGRKRLCTTSLQEVSNWSC